MTDTLAPVNVAGFNRRVALGRRKAEQHLPALERAYARLIREASLEAARDFRALTAAATPDWQPPPAGTILGLSALGALAVDRLTRVYRKIVKDVQEPALARIGISFDITHPITADLLAKAGARTGAALGDAIQPVLVKAVAQGYADGLSVDDTAKLIQADIADAADWQAKMLARTDLNSLSNGGSVGAAKQAGLTYKTWLTAGDERVREAHMEANNQTVPVDQPFTVGGENLEYPGDPEGSDEEVINCRCTVIYADSLTASAKGDTMLADKFVRIRPDNSPFMAELVTEIKEYRKHLGLPAKPLTAAVTITVDEAQAAPVAWRSDLAFEGMATEDGRYILPGALSWRDLPLTLMAMTVTSEGGHEGAFVAGRIDTMDKEDRGDGVTAVVSSGVFDSAGDNGSEVARLVADETVRGVSVDLAINDYAFRDPETGELIEPDEMDEADMERMMFGELQMAVRAATIMAATVCPTPAFADARIAVTASGQHVVRCVAPIEIIAAPLTASAAGLAPKEPPRDWFFKKEPDHLTPLTVTDHGQVYGHIAPWDGCHTGFPGQCIPPPRSPSGYAYYNLGEVRCSDGSRVTAGALTLEALHAPTTPGTSADRARQHYENTAVVAAFVRAVDGRCGIWVAGALRPNLSEQHARDLMGAKPSGDWRQTRMGGPLEMLGIHAVNEPGFPVPRLAASAMTASGTRIAFQFGEPDPAVERRLSILATRAEAGLGGLLDRAGV